MTFSAHIILPATRIVLSATFLLTCGARSGGQEHVPRNGQLEHQFDGQYGQVEVGGRYVGAEFHKSRPLPSRISFYYPVANSIDLSTDYWTRADSSPLAIGIQIGRSKKFWLGRDGWDYTLSPHRVRFDRRDRALEYDVEYEFCLNRPAMVLTLTVTNRTENTLTVEVYTHLKLSLRTCQTYARKDSSEIEYNAPLHLVAAHFDDPETGKASVFVQNVGEKPSAWFTDAGSLGVTDSGTSNWMESTFAGLRSKIDNPGKVNGVAAYAYKKELQPGRSFIITQGIGSCRRNEVASTATYLATSWEKEIRRNDEYVRRKALGEVKFSTSDPWLDRSAAWARGILASNAHYLDGVIVPMPCPAEYNFFFTHDMLLTDLAAVNFDPDRVKRDLLYIILHAKDLIIPHAYYWRDDGFKTEYCSPENWNHMWFILTASSYMRHSFDVGTGKLLLPLVTKSVHEILKQRIENNLMVAAHPDWWDIGRKEGPRAYTTILTIRALREYLYFCSRLGIDSPELIDFENRANAMETALNDRLWDTKLHYLVNWNEGAKDNHIYMGSLLAAVYGLVKPERARELTATASKQLMDSRIGVRVVSPADFHTDSSRAYFQFVGNEAGDPFTYINGGVWPHANAWYALALREAGQTDEAYQFVRQVMTLDGIVRSPNGQPAMYEYRYSNPDSPRFGAIDKPSFLWAAGFYLSTLYHLFGVSETEWNLRIRGPLPSQSPSARYSLSFGGLKDVSIGGKGDRLKKFAADGEDIPSLVIPLDRNPSKRFTVDFGHPAPPYLEEVNAIVHSVRFDKSRQTLSIVLSSFTGHATHAKVVSPLEPKRVLLDGKGIAFHNTKSSVDATTALSIPFTGSSQKQTLEIEF